MIDGNSGAATPLAAELGSNAAPSVFVAALRLVFVTLPYFLIRAVMSILSLVWTILVLLGSFASPLFRLLSPVLSFLSPYLIPRKFILSISLDPLGLFRAVISIALIVGVYYLWRYVWGGRYTRLPATDPEVRWFFEFFSINCLTMYRLKGPQISAVVSGARRSPQRCCAAGNARRR